MGYESKLIVGLRNHFNHTKHRDYCQDIMTLNLSKMGDSRFSNFSHELFDKKIDFDLYREDGNTVYEKDDCGDICHYTSLNRVIEALEDISKSQPYYRRADLALKALKAFKDKDWTVKGSAELVVVHFGY